MELTNLWWIWPYAGMVALIVLYWLIRMVIDLYTYRQFRKMAPYTMRYSAADYWGSHRPNFRKP